MDLDSLCAQAGLLYTLAGEHKVIAEKRQSLVSELAAAFGGQRVALAA